MAISQIVVFSINFFSNKLIKFSYEKTNCNRAFFGRPILCKGTINQNHKNVRRAANGR
jgi:hypothetical protein